MAKFSKPREYTEDEVTERFINQCRGTAKYWSELEGPTSTEKVYGAVFSMLSMIDGCSMGTPGWIIAPNPHPDDKDFMIKVERNNYYPENITAKVKCNISGGLHELFAQKEGK